MGFDRSSVRRLSACAVIAGVSVSGCASSDGGIAAISGIETPGNTQIPLPPGEWKLLASKGASSGRVMGGGFNNQHSVEVEYGRIEGGMLTALAYVTTSVDAPSQGGYVTGLPCITPAKPDFVYFNDVRSSTVNAVDCMVVRGDRVFNAPSASSSEVYRETYEKAKAYGGIPRRTVEVNFAQAHSFRYMNYTVWFFPERAGVPVANVSWRSDQLAAPTRKFVDGIVDWAKGFEGVVRLGTEYRL